VIVIDVPSLYVPPAVETLPPSPADTVKVYWVTEVVGLVVFVGGVFRTWESSLAQVRMNSKDKYVESFLINKFITFKLY